MPHCNCFAPTRGGGTRPHEEGPSLYTRERWSVPQIARFPSENPPNMTGRPGCWTMEMNGGSSASYLAHTSSVSLFCSLLNRGGLDTEGFSDYQGRAEMISTVRWNFRPVVIGVEKYSHLVLKWPLWANVELQDKRNNVCSFPSKLVPSSFFT